MGWTYTRSLEGHASPRGYLDAQFTTCREGTSMRVLRSALVRMRTYYAAIEAVTPSGHEIFCVVCPILHDPRESEGYVFGYKAMREEMVPYETECPVIILDLLTPTANALALEWRARCRAHAAERARIRAKPMPRPGQLIAFDESILFRGGATHRMLRVIKDPRSHRTVLFQDPATGALFRIPNVKARTYTLLEGGAETEPCPVHEAARQDASARRKGGPDQRSEREDVAGLEKDG